MLLPKGMAHSLISTVKLLLISCSLYSLQFNNSFKSGMTLRPILLPPLEIYLSNSLNYGLYFKLLVGDGAAAVTFIVDPKVFPIVFVTALSLNL